MKNPASRAARLFSTRSLFLLAGVALGVGLAGSAAAQSPGAAPSPVPEGTQVEEVAGGFEFLEGPYWHPDGHLLFSDIPANTVYKWTPNGDSVAVFRRPSGNSNGITADGEGRLVLAQHGWRRLARVEENGQETPLAERYEGQRLNSPNDAAVASDGAIYFTDPPYGVEDEARELDFSGVYRLTPEGEVELITDAFERPNGIVLAPDESRLYVNDTRGGFIQAFDLTADSTAMTGRRFATLDDPDAEGNADGMAVDAEGRLYSTGPGGLWIFGTDGQLVDRIPVPQPATNVTFGGAANDTLFITAGSKLYRIRVNATGAR